MGDLFADITKPYLTIGNKIGQTHPEWLFI
jgi:hypothetical protein